MRLKVEEHVQRNTQHGQQEKTNQQSRNRVVAHVDEDSRVDVAREVLALQDARS